MASVVLAGRMGHTQYHGKRIGPNIFELHHLGEKIRVPFECDNSSVFAAVNRHYSKEQIAMHLLRSLWFFVAYFDIDIKCKHIAGVNNSTADHLSRGNLHSFFCLHPQATRQPTPLPPPLLQILATGGPD